jgi:hypothetical protein
LLDHCPGENFQLPPVNISSDRCHGRLLGLYSYLRQRRLLGRRASIRRFTRNHAVQL